MLIFKKQLCHTVDCRCLYPCYTQGQDPTPKARKGFRAAFILLSTAMRIPGKHTQSANKAPDEKAFGFLGMVAGDSLS